jgi:DNA polymerase (family 10)
VTRLPLGRAHQLASVFGREARRAGIAIESMTPVGSLRRYAPDIGDVTLFGVAPTAAHEQLLAAFSALPIVTSVVAADATSVTVRADRGQVRLLLAAPEHAGRALVWHTGSWAHTSSLQARAALLGLTLHDTGLQRDGAELSCATEIEFYAHLQLPYIAPELREGADEIDAAERSALPDLISIANIRGDLHMHSTWSDGRDSLEDMVLASRQLGYEYIAITDHSERAWSSRALAASQVPEQRAEIALLRDRHPGIQILHGVEVDILPDGSLDFDDALLAGFDLVLASLHDAGKHGGARLTERYLGAIDHPLVNVITHPANRSPAQSAGYDVDFDRLFEAAAATGTAMEIDGAPGHLDLDGALARRAIAAGVTLVIDSDGHRADALAQQMRFGVGTARRGWVEAAHVLNARHLEDVRAFVARKRQIR